MLPEHSTYEVNTTGLCHSASQPTRVIMQNLWCAGDAQEVYIWQVFGPSFGLNNFIPQLPCAPYAGHLL